MYRRSIIIGQLRDEDKWKKKKKNHASLAVTMFTNFNVIYSKLYKKLQPAHYSLSLICLVFYPFYLHSNTILWKLWIMFNVNLQPNKLFSYGFPEATKYKLDRARYSKNNWRRNLTSWENSYTNKTSWVLTDDNDLFNKKWLRVEVNIFSHCYVIINCYLMHISLHKKTYKLAKYWAFVVKP